MHRIHVTTSASFSSTSGNGPSGAGLEPASNGHEAAWEHRSHRPRRVSLVVQTVPQDLGSHHVSPTIARAGSSQRLRCAS